MQFRGGMNELLRQASRVQRKIEETKAEYKLKMFEVSGANDKVKVVVNGAREVVSIDVDPAFMQSEDRSLVFDAITATINAGLAKAGTELDASLEKLTGGAKIPGLY
ncbi:MAG: YbaB/EbfC family nucleoid-associated protein [Deltaproteobacteria bacterium]|nr:YbaB/EbfC family nucleoid-associated protein [Deltaproteobacteria bacterium]